MLNCLVVALGGGIGACLRYLIGLISLKEPFSFPVKTLVINLLGCFVIGLIAALAAREGEVLRGIRSASSSRTTGHKSRPACKI